MADAPKSASLHWKDLPHPVIAGLISVIVNYGGTFILVFQAAKSAGILDAADRLADIVVGQIRSRD